MEQSTHQNRSQTQNHGIASASKQFFAGMQAYAVSRPEQLHALCRLSSAALTGILLGIFAYFFWDAEPVTDIRRAANDYITARAFSSYGSLRAYLTFFSAWFFHHALPTLLPLCTVITFYPTVLCYGITALRGFLCGFTVCTLSGTFSPFSVYLTFAQTALCALCVYLGTKCIRYATHRASLPAKSKNHRTLRWMLTESAPLAAAVLITITALAAGLLLISGICTLLITLTD